MLDLTKFKGQPLKCAGLGEVLFDVFKEGPRIGGAPANFAYHCSALGLNSVVVSAVGNDELGRRALQILQDFGLNTAVQTVDKPTGSVSVEVDKDGMPTYTFLSDTAYDNIACTDDFLQLAAGTQICCFGSLAQRSECSRRSIQRFLQTMDPDLRLRIFDVNLRQNFFSKETILSSLAETEIFKCNDEELPVLMKLLGLPAGDEHDFYHYLNSLGIYGFIYTCGAASSTVMLNAEVSTLPTPKVHAVSTVGAGDAFTASIITLLLKGKTLKEAHKLACRVSAFVCTQEGAMPRYDKMLLQAVF